MNGNRALQVVERIKPDLFLLDDRLPDMNGIELYDHLHASKELEAVPALIVSARFPQYEARKRNLLCLQKPIKLDELLQTIEKLITEAG
jgi:CheY-like chemotaxis protein